MTTENKAKWIAGAVTGLFLLAATSTVYFYGNRNEYKSQAEQALLKHDSILSMKQLLDKEIADIRIELADARSRNAGLDEELIIKENELKSRQEKIDQLVAHNASVQSLKNQLAELKAEREAMNLRIQTLLTENQNLNADNQRLKNNVVVLENEKQALQSKLTATDLSMNRAGNFRVDMLRSNGKVTAKAKRTRDIRVSFDIPANSSNGTTGLKDIYVVVIDPQGSPVKGEKTAAESLNNGSIIYPLERQSIDLAKNPQTVAVDISLESKVKAKGIYQVRVYTLDGQIGSSQITMN